MGWLGCPWDGWLGRINLAHVFFRVIARQDTCEVLSEWGQWYPTSRSLFPSTLQEKF